MVEFKRTMEPWLRLKKNKTWCFFFPFGCWLLTLSKLILKRAAVLHVRRYLLLIKTFMTLRLSFKNASWRSASGISKITETSLL